MRIERNVEKILQDDVGKPISQKIGVGKLTSLRILGKSFQREIATQDNPVETESSNIKNISIKDGDVITRYRISDILKRKNIVLRGLKIEKSVPLSGSKISTSNDITKTSTSVNYAWCHELSTGKIYFCENNEWKEDVDVYYDGTNYWISDEYDMITGQLIQRVGVYTFTGTEEWGSVTDRGSNCFSAYKSNLLPIENKAELGLCEVGTVVTSFTGITNTAVNSTENSKGINVLIVHPYGTPARQHVQSVFRAGTEYLYSLKTPITSNVGKIEDDIIIKNDNAITIIDSDAIILVKKEEVSDTMVGVTLQKGNIANVDISNEINNIGMHELVELRNQIIELNSSVQESIKSMRDLKYDEGGEIIINIPGKDVDLENVNLRLALHYGDQEGDSLFNEIFFEGNCRKDFSDIRFEDENGNIIKHTIESYGDYDFIKDSNLCKNPWWATLKLSDGTLLASTPSPTKVIKSEDNGETWTDLAVGGVSGQVFFVDSDDNIYVNGKGVSTGKVIKYYASTGYTTSKELLDFSAVNGYVKELGAVEDNDGCIYFGRYQEDWTPGASIFVSSDSGETFQECYHSDKQHVHILTVDRATNIVYAGIDDSRTVYGAQCIRSEDHGQTWVNIPVPYRNRDYLSYFGNGFALGGGECSILGGCTVYKTTDIMNPKEYKPVINNGQGVRTIMSPKPGIIIVGGNSGDTVPVEQIFMSTDEGETWKTIYAGDWDREPGPGDGVRWFTEPFTPKGATEEQIIITGTGRTYGIRAKFGSDYGYGLCYLNLGLLPTTGRTIKVKYGYAMQLPRVKYKKRNIVEPVFWLPLNEGNGRVVKEFVTGKLGTIIGNYEWVKDETVNRFGSFIFPNEKNPDCYALRLAKDSYIKLGRFENLNFNKGFTIGFWLNPERYLKYTYNEGERKILLSNGKVEVGIEQAWGQIAFTPENKETHAFLNYAAMAMNMYNLHFMTFTNDELPTMSTYVNDYTTPRATKTATNWGVGLLSDGDLYVGIPNATDTKYTMPHGIGGIMIWDKVLTDDERAAIFNGCTLLEG